MFIIDSPSNPVPSASAVSPSCAAPGVDIPLVVTGTNFLSASGGSSQVAALASAFGGSQFQFTGPAATITTTQITVTIPKADASAAGNATVTVYNPPSLPLNVPGSTGSGGGTSIPSAASSVTIQSAPCPVAAKAQASSELSGAVAEETPAVSLDARYVAYTAVHDERAHIFLRDTCEGAATGCQPSTTLLSVAADGTVANDESHAPSMSSDGRYVAFSSAATNLVENAPPGRQVYLRDTCAGAADSCKPATQLISLDSNGALVGTESILPSVSSSGRFIAFLAVTPSHSSNEVSSPGGTAASGKDSGYPHFFIPAPCPRPSNSA